MVLTVAVGLTAVVVALVLGLFGSSTRPAAAPCHPIGGPIRVGESIRATYVPTHLVLVSGSETNPRAAPVIYGLPASAKTELGPVVTVRVLPAVPLASMVPTGLVSKQVTIQGHPALLATTPPVVPNQLTSEIGRVHIYWQRTADSVISLATSEMAESLAIAIANGISYVPGQWMNQYYPGELRKVSGSPPSGCPGPAGG
ncbi:MAG TPA: hypothetical protein VFA11_09685 [Acidimicrobiales bacterium]|nr:hypothetical protein [Acidimicrobiales bacterium]